MTQKSILPKRQMKAKERMRNEALRILGRLKSLPAWEASLSAEWKAAIARQFGSPETLYNRLRDELVKQSQDPAPNVFTVGPDGRAVFGWE